MNSTPALSSWAPPQVKAREDKIAELSFWKHTALEKLQAAERENLQLRKKVDELLRLTDQLSGGEWHTYACCVYVCVCV